MIDLNIVNFFTIGMISLVMWALARFLAGYFNFSIPGVV